MKRTLIFLILLAFGGFAANAQYAPVDGNLSYRFGGIYDSNGHRLTRSEGNANYFLTPEQQRLFKRGQNQYYWGAGLIVGTTAMLVIGSSVQDDVDAVFSGEPSRDRSGAELVIWSASIMTGVPLMITGVVLFCSGRHKLKDLTENYNFYNQKNAVSLSFGPQQYGFGLALRF